MRCPGGLAFQGLRRLEDPATLVTLRDFLDTVSGPDLIAGLQAARGNGRDDYPIARRWRVVLLTIARGGGAGPGRAGPVES
jgi:hypothetical protein